MSPTSPLSVRRASSKIKETEIDPKTLGEPIFSYPPIVFEQKDSHFSNWYHIGKLKSPKIFV